MPSTTHPFECRQHVGWVHSETVTTVAPPVGDHPDVPLNPHALACRLVSIAPPAHWTLSELAHAMHAHYPELSPRALRRIVWDCINAGVLRFQAEPATPAAVLNRRRLILCHGPSRLQRATAQAQQRTRALNERAAA
jgi:hypothetical protein